MQEIDRVHSILPSKFSPDDPSMHKYSRASLQRRSFPRDTVPQTHLYMLVMVGLDHNHMLSFSLNEQGSVDHVEGGLKGSPAVSAPPPHLSGTFRYRVV